MTRRCPVWKALLATNSRPSDRIFYQAKRKQVTGQTLLFRIARMMIVADDDSGAVQLWVLLT